MEDLEAKCGKITLEEENSVSLRLENLESNEGINAKFCLLGKFLIERAIDFQAMQHTLASLWRPGRGLFVKLLEPNLFIFQFFHEVDLKRVVNGSPWFFNCATLLIKRLEMGMNPRSIELHHLDMWIRVFDLSPDLFCERVAEEIGNAIGSFVEADQNNFSRIWRDYLGIRVTVDIKKPLRRKLKIQLQADSCSWVYFQYERVPNICFFCGIIGHTEKFCHKLFEDNTVEPQRLYGEWMRVNFRRKIDMGGTKWIRKEGEKSNEPTVKEDMRWSDSKKDEENKHDEAVGNSEKEDVHESTKEIQSASLQLEHVLTVYKNSIKRRRVENQNGDDIQKESPQRIVSSITAADTLSLTGPVKQAC